MAYHKLSDRRSFQAVFDGRCGSTRSLLRMMAVPNQQGVARLGLVVGRKICPSAVGRNYMKRVGRELFRKHALQLAGLDIVIVIRKHFEKRDFSLLSSEFEGLAQNIQKCRDLSNFSSASTKLA